MRGRTRKPAGSALRLVNTGGTGGPFGVCTRRPIGFTRAIIQAMSDLEQLCSKDNAPEVVSSLLKQIDVVTGLSSSDPRRNH